MRFRIPLLLGLVLLCAMQAAAQSAPEIFIPQRDGWRVQVGDNPAWASPAFDDSSWTTTSLDLATFPRNLLAGHSRWFRKRIHLPQTGAMQLVVATYDGSYEVYVDGRRVSPPFPSPLRWQASVTRIFPLRGADNPGGGDVEVAIRSHLYNQAYWFIRPPFVGVANPAGATRFKFATDGRILGAAAFPLAVYFILVLAGGILISLYAQQRGRREYLWLGLCVLCSGFSSLLQTGGVYVPASWNAFFGDPCEYWFVVTYIEFVYAFVGRTPSRPVRAYQWFLVAAPFVVSPLAWAGAFNPNSYSWLENLLILPGFVLTLTMLVVWTRRGNREAAVLIGPMFLANVGYWIAGLQVAVIALHPSFAGFPALRLGLWVFDYVPVSQAIFLLAIGLVIFLRFVRVSREQSKTQAELEAARAVQQVLVPEQLPEVAGLHIECVYNPAGEVGGDFFQAIALPGGSVLIAIGDVSGKGMPAAMTVSMLVGTFRTLAQFLTAPSVILDAMNQRMMGRAGGGFTTCLVARVEPDGVCTLANAGHLHPYRNGAELSLESGVPLGIAAPAEFAETNLRLAPSDRLTFLTDGVVEARSHDGELFGFDRTRQISTQSAEAIARAAQTHGQEDDITVLTLTFAPAEALQATTHSTRLIM